MVPVLAGFHMSVGDRNWFYRLVGGREFGVGHADVSASPEAYPELSRKETSSHRKVPLMKLLYHGAVSVPESHDRRRDHCGSAANTWGTGRPVVMSRIAAPDWWDDHGSAAVPVHYSLPPTN